MTEQSGTPFRVVVVNAGVSDPSSTRLLADRAAQRVVSLGAERGHEVSISAIDLREILPELPAALSSQLLGKKFTAAVAALAQADVIIAATPVYKAAASGLFTSFFQVLDNDLLIGKPVILGRDRGHRSPRSRGGRGAALPVRLPAHAAGANEPLRVDRGLERQGARRARGPRRIRGRAAHGVWIRHQGAGRVVEALPTRIRLGWRHKHRHRSQQRSDAARSGRHLQTPAGVSQGNAIRQALVDQQHATYER